MHKVGKSDCLELLSVPPSQTLCRVPSASPLPTAHRPATGPSLFWLASAPAIKCILAFRMGLLTHRLPVVPSVQLTLTGTFQVPGMSCHVWCFHPATRMDLAWIPLQVQPSEGPGVAAVHSSNSDWGLGRESQRKTRGVFSEKNCHCSHLLGLTLAWSGSKHCPCVSSFKLPTYHRRWGHPHFFSLSSSR